MTNFVNKNDFDIEGNSIAVDKSDSSKYYMKQLSTPIRDPKIFSTIVDLDHPAIGKVKGCTKDSKPCIFTQFYAKGSLADIIKISDIFFDSDFNNTKKQIALIGIARGMMILHKHKILNKDLKPEKRKAPSGTNYYMNSHRNIFITTCHYVLYVRSAF